MGCERLLLAGDAVGHYGMAGHPAHVRLRLVSYRRAIVGEVDLIRANRRPVMWRGALLLVATVLLSVACSGNSAAPAATPAGGTPATTLTPATTQPAAGTTEQECRDALLKFDAYSVAKQKGAADASDANAARSRCLASTDVPPTCVEAMRLSVTMVSASADSIDFVTAFTAYRESSTLCRVKLLKSI